MLDIIDAVLVQLFRFTIFFIPTFVIWNFSKKGIIGLLVRGLFWIYFLLMLGLVSFNSVFATMRNGFILYFSIAVVSWIPISRWRHKREYLLGLDEEQYNIPKNLNLERNIWFGIIGYFVFANVLFGIIGVYFL